MEVASYPAQVELGQLVEQTALFNDGHTLRVSAGGVEFSGPDFDSLEPSADADPEALAQFRLHNGELCEFLLRFGMPMPISDQAEPAELLVEVAIGKPAANGGVDACDVRLVLKCQHGEFPTAGTSGWFEDELKEIQSQLPEGVHLRACINCMFSDYSPAGHGMFGDMFCFRNIKDEYLQVKSKRDYWSVHERHERTVQETYLCDQFQRRTPGHGYR